MNNLLHPASRSSSFPPRLLAFGLAVLILNCVFTATAVGKRSTPEKRAMARGELPRPSKKDAGKMTFDARYPCFNRDEMGRARRALFRERRVSNPTTWMRALNRAFHELGANCESSTLLLTVLTIVQQESGVSVDPRLDNRNLPELLGFKLQRLNSSNPLAAKLLSASGIEDALKAKLRRDNGRVKLNTEGDLVRYVEQDLKVWFNRYLQKEFNIPEQVAKLAAEIGISTPVTTLGPMQVNVEKAYRNARGRGEEIRSSRQMLELLLGKGTALERGLKEGVHLVWQSYRFYRKKLPGLRAARYTAADYNSGEFSSRNAAFQVRVAALAGKKLVLDGDLLVYRDGEIQGLISNTEEALKIILPSHSREQIRESLLLEKSAGFSDSRTARVVCIGYKRRMKKPCQVARVPAGANNATGNMKTGRRFTPEDYTMAFMQRYEKNRAAFRRD